MADHHDFTDEQLESLYAWVDQLPLTKSKKNIARDFSDGVMVAECVQHYFPQVDIHGICSSCNTEAKKRNWFFMNRKLLAPVLGVELSKNLIEDLSNSKPGTIEKLLMELRRKIDQKLKPEDMHSNRQFHQHQHHHLHDHENDKPEADQNIVQQRRVKGKSSGHNQSHGFKPPDLLAPQFEKITNNHHSRKKDQAGRTGVQRQKQPEISKKDMADLKDKYEAKERECLEKEELIAVLIAKQRRLEHLIHLKDLRLEELQAQIEEFRPSAISHKH